MDGNSRGGADATGQQPGSGPPDPADLRIGQAPADVAAIGLLHERNVRRRDTVAEQVQGKLAERLGIDMDRAFRMLRDYARTSNQHLTDVARDFVNGATAESPGVSRTASSRTNRRRAMLEFRRYRRDGNELPATLRRSCQGAQHRFTTARDNAVQVYGEGDQADRPHSRP